MIDDYNEDRTGWARFSEDRMMRYRLARAVINRRFDVFDGCVIDAQDMFSSLRRVVFLMLNPSTADAFQLDPTIKRCRARAIRMGADVLEVVNLFAFRSPYPQDLRQLARGARGDDMANDHQILAACRGASHVIAAWGNHGTLDNRAQIVTGMLQRERIPLWHLGKTNQGHPLHPLARGKASIPDSRELEAYEP